MPRHSNRFAASTLLTLLTLLTAAARCLAAESPANLPAGYKLLYEQKCDRDSALKEFVMTDPRAWRFSKEDKGSGLELFQQSHYEPAVRSPINIALVADKIFGDFVLEAELLYSSKGMVEPPDEELLIPLGQAEVKREGSDVSVICYAQTVPLALAVAAQLEEEDISAEIVDLRSIKPLDEKVIFDSVAKTHRVVIVEQDRPFCGVGAEVCYRVQKNIFDELDAPIIRVSQEDVPMPYNERLEKAVLPNADKLIAAVKKVCYA